MLRAIAELRGDALPEIRGVVYDKASQRLVLVGERAVKVPILHESDLAMALWLTFGPRQADPQFSLDPADPRNPRGKWLKAVYLPIEMAGTPFGENLFEADWLMKQLSFAVKVTADGKMEARKLAIPNFKSVRDLMMDAGHLPQDQHQWARLWLYSDKMIVELKDDTLSFVTATIGVRSCKQVVDPTSPTGLRDADCDKVTVESQWAKQFTARYGEVAKELPEFARLTELAKAVAIAKWLKKEGVAVDLDWVVNQVNKRTIKGTAQVTALSVNWTSQQRLPFNDSRGQGIQTITRTLNLFGGVDLTVKPQYVPDKGAAKALQQAVFKGLSDHPGESVFELQVGGKAYYAKVLPLNPRFHSVQVGRTESGKANNTFHQTITCFPGFCAPKLHRMKPGVQRQHFGIVCLSPDLQFKD